MLGVSDDEMMVVLMNRQIDAPTVVTRDAGGRLAEYLHDGSDPDPDPEPLQVAQLAGTMPEADAVLPAGPGPAEGLPEIRATPQHPVFGAIQKGANRLADLIDKGATTFQVLDVMVPGGLDRNKKVKLPIAFDPSIGKVNPATGERQPATLGMEFTEITLGELLDNLPFSELVGVRGLARTAESLSYGEAPDAFDAIEAVGVTAGGAQAARMAGKGALAAGKALVPKAGEMAADLVERAGIPVRGLNAVAPGPAVVSTRLPTAVNATENPLAERLVIDLQAAKRDPDAFAHNMSLVRQYPNFASRARNPERQAEDFIEGVKDNLLFLHDQVPAATRERSRLWYDGARNITDRFAADYGFPDQAVAGVLAVLSPQKDWFMNVSLGQRVLDIVKNQQATRWDASMDEMAAIIWNKPQYAPMIDAIRGKTLAEIDDPGLKAMWLRTFDQAKLPREHQIVTPEGDFAGLRTNADGSPSKTGWGSLNEIGKAIVILGDPRIEVISGNLGQQHKVRNFYNNIYAPGDPAGHVTIDTHAVAAGLVRPLSGNSREVAHNFGQNIKGERGPANSSITGVQGTYGLYAEAYRRAAAERGLLPREMQSITWEAVRGLFPDTFKTAANAARIDDVWVQYRRGRLSLDEARNEVFRIAGGINAPEWERAGRGAGAPQEVRPAVDAGQLPRPGVPGRSAGGSRRVEPAPGDSAAVNRGRRAPDAGAQ
jgi:hypothetical protein